jgi:hypothetical protein
VTFHLRLCSKSIAEYIFLSTSAINRKCSGPSLQPAQVEGLLKRVNVLNSVVSGDLGWEASCANRRLVYSGPLANSYGLETEIISHGIRTGEWDLFQLLCVCALCACMYISMYLCVSKAEV